VSLWLSGGRKGVYRRVPVRPALEQLEKREVMSGTPSLVRDIAPGSVSGLGFESNLTNVSGTLFFMANDGSHGFELWKSNGTCSGTTLVSNINPGSYGAVRYFGGFLTNMSGTLFFSANDGSHGYQLWKSDGTSSGTVMLSDVNTSGYGPDPEALTNVNGTDFLQTERQQTG
jgi:ELWxxDGT repeat protein